MAYPHALIIRKAIILIPT